jgi:hypothetical protein
MTAPLRAGAFHSTDALPSVTSTTATLVGGLGGSIVVVTVAEESTVVPLVPSAFTAKTSIVYVVPCARPSMVKDDAVVALDSVRSEPASCHLTTYLKVSSAEVEEVEASQDSVTVVEVVSSTVTAPGAAGGSPAVVKLTASEAGDAPSGFTACTVTEYVELAASPEILEKAVTVSAVFALPLLSV